MNVIGLDRKQLYGTARALGEFAHDNIELVGFDVCEIETFLAGRHFKNGVTDQTFEVVSDVIRLLLGYEARYGGTGSTAEIVSRHSFLCTGTAKGISDAK